jgi:hypothetical protein
MSKLEASNDRTKDNSLSPKKVPTLSINNNVTRLPWGAVKEKTVNSNSSPRSPSTPLSSMSSSGDKFFSNLKPNENQIKNNEASVENKKPGEYVMHLVMLNFIQLSAKKLEQILNGEKRVSVCLTSNKINF